MDQETIQEYREQQLEAQKDAQLLDTIKQTGDRTANTVSRTVIAVDKANKTRTVKVDVQNNLATTTDIKLLTKATLALGSVLKPKEIEPLIDGLKNLSVAINNLPSQMPVAPEIEIPEQKESVSVTNLSELDKLFKDVVTAVENLPKQMNLNPSIEVKPADVVVQDKEVDFKPLLNAVASLEKTVKSQVMPTTDMKPVIEAVKKVSTTLNSLSFPVPNYVLPYKDENGAATQAQLTNGAVTTADKTFATRIDNTAAPTVYIGKASVGSLEADPVWQIAKLDTSSGLSKTWAGTAGFDQIWANRSGLTYQ
jgi:hypothetical protein